MMFLHCLNIFLMAQEGKKLIHFFFFFSQKFFNIFHESLDQWERLKDDDFHISLSLSLSLSLSFYLFLSVSFSVSLFVIGKDERERVKIWLELAHAFKQWGWEAPTLSSFAFRRLERENFLFWSKKLLSSSITTFRARLG